MLDLLAKKLYAIENSKHAFSTVMVRGTSVKVPINEARAVVTDLLQGARAARKAKRQASAQHVKTRQAVEAGTRATREEGKKTRQHIDAWGHAVLSGLPVPV